jgi:hypothetical protein
MPHPYRVRAHLARPDPVQLQFDFGDPGPGAAQPPRPVIDDPHPAESDPTECPERDPTMAAEDRQLSLF